MVGYQYGKDTAEKKSSGFFLSFFSKDKIGRINFKLVTTFIQYWDSEAELKK